MCSYSSFIQKGIYTYARVAQSVRASVLCTGGRGFNPHRVQAFLFYWSCFSNTFYRYLKSNSFVGSVLTAIFIYMNCDGLYFILPYYFPSIVDHTP